MKLAIEEASAAEAHGDVPVGAVVVGGDGLLLARRHNEKELLGNPTAHAEMLALADASKALGGWRCTGATLVVTLEPCTMCAGAAVAARLTRVVYGAADPKAGACGSLYTVCSDPRLNWAPEVVPGVGAEESGRLLTAFFASRRAKGLDR